MKMKERKQENNEKIPNTETDPGPKNPKLSLSLGLDSLGQGCL